MAHPLCCKPCPTATPLATPVTVMLKGCGKFLFMFCEPIVTCVKTISGKTCNGKVRDHVEIEGNKPFKITTQELKDELEKQCRFLSLATYI